MSSSSTGGGLGGMPEWQASLQKAQQDLQALVDSLAQAPVTGAHRKVKGIFSGITDYFSAARAERSKAERQCNELLNQVNITDPKNLTGDDLTAYHTALCELQIQINDIKPSKETEASKAALNVIRNWSKDKLDKTVRLADYQIQLEDAQNNPTLEKIERLLSAAKKNKDGWKLEPNQKKKLQELQARVSKQKKSDTFYEQAQKITFDPTTREWLGRKEIAKKIADCLADASGRDLKEVYGNKVVDFCIRFEQESRNAYDTYAHLCRQEGKKPTTSRENFISSRQLALTEKLNDIAKGTPDVKDKAAALKMRQTAIPQLHKSRQLIEESIKKGSKKAIKEVKSYGIILDELKEKLAHLVPEESKRKALEDTLVDLEILRRLFFRQNSLMTLLTSAPADEEYEKQNIASVKQLLNYSEKKTDGWSIDPEITKALEMRVKLFEAKPQPTISELHRQLGDKKLSNGEQAEIRRYVFGMLMKPSNAEQLFTAIDRGILKEMIGRGNEKFAEEIVVKLTPRGNVIEQLNTELKGVEFRQNSDGTFVKTYDELKRGLLAINEGLAWSAQRNWAVQSLGRLISDESKRNNLMEKLPPDVDATHLEKAITDLEQTGWALFEDLRKPTSAAKQISALKQGVKQYREMYSLIERSLSDKRKGEFVSIGDLEAGLRAVEAAALAEAPQSSKDVEKQSKVEEKDSSSVTPKKPARKRPRKGGGTHEPKRKSSGRVHQ